MKFKFPIILFLLFLIYFQWWLPHSRVATDFSKVSSNTLKSQMNIPQTWSIFGTEGLGEYAVFTLWSWPFSFLNGVLANLGFSFEVLERMLYIIPFLFIGNWSIKKICEHINLSRRAQFVSSLFYLTNTYILLVIDGGQLTIALAYVSFPMAYMAIEKSIFGKFKHKILAGLLISTVGFFDFRFIFVLLILCILRFLYEFFFLSFRKWLSWILEWVKTGIISALVIIGLNFYWLFVLFKAPLSLSTYSYLTQTSFISLVSLGHAVLMLSPHWFKNVFGQVTELKFEFILIPILAFLAPILKPKSKMVGFWLIVAIFALFLSKGSSKPFSQIYPWLYSNIPLFSLFRDSSKFFFLITLSFAVLIGITVDEVTKRIRVKKISLAFIFILTIYFIFLIRPIFLGSMTGTFSSPSLRKEFLQLESTLGNDKQTSNVFWIPTISPLTNLDFSHPALEAVRLVHKRPFAQATVGTYEIFNFLREAPYMGEIFDVSGISYIVYPPLDPRRNNLHPDNINYYYTFSSQLTKLPWLERIEESPIALWKTKSAQEKFFMTANLLWVIGSDSIYNEVFKNANLKLSKNALIFPEEYPNLGKRLDEFENAKIVLNNKTKVDLAATFINFQDLIHPAKNLNYDPDSSGWWKRETKDLILWRYFLRDKYGIDNLDFDLGGGWAVGEKKLKLKIQNLKLNKGSVLLARVMESSRSGNLRFYQDEEPIGEITTKIEKDTNVRWFEIGYLKEDGKSLTIKSEGDINVVNTLALLEKDVWEGLKNKAEELKTRIVKFDENLIEDSDSNLKLIYEQISPTKYKIYIDGLTKPSFLVFSQAYHDFWKLDNKLSLPVYSLLNGFKVEKNGEYILEFEPQKLVSYGALISIFTLILILFLLKRGKVR